MQPINIQSSPWELKEIPAVSPSLAETLRNCQLQAGFTRIHALNDFVLGNPKAWLGSAYHQVLENLWSRTEEELTEAALIDRLWNEAILKLYQRTKLHPLNNRFGDPQKWAGYYLARSFVEIRAKQILAEDPRQRSSSGAHRDSTKKVRETEFSAMQGKLIGRPDVVMDDEIRDYKSGSVYDGTPEGKHTVKEAYLRQLRLYGQLVRERQGRCPSKGKLLPMQGDPVEIRLDAATCATEAAEAVALLDAYNTHLKTAPSVSALASPAATTCRWCQYKTACPAFWANVSQTWTADLGSPCIRGVLTDSPTPIHSGQAIAVTIRVEGGTVPAGASLKIMPFAKDTHTQLATSRAGDNFRIINLYQRNDGQFTPTPITVGMREAEIPTFSLPIQEISRDTPPQR